MPAKGQKRKPRSWQASTARSPADIRGYLVSLPYVVQLANATVVPKVSAAWMHAFDDVTPGASLAFATTGIGSGIT